MEVPTYQRKFEELKRSLNRIQKLYDGLIINGEGEDSFQSPKDIVLSFFRVGYELKEALKFDGPNHLRGYNGIIESFCSNDDSIALALDFANHVKHGTLRSGRSGKTLGKMNSHVHIFSPDGRDRTEITIEIDNKKEDCLKIAQLAFDSWKSFLEENSLIKAS